MTTTIPAALESIQSAVVSITTRTPEDAMSADLLGTDRVGHGIRIRPDGLIVTIGYVISDADEVWVGTHRGAAVPAVVIGHDSVSGLGLVRPTLPIKGKCIELGSAADLEPGDEVTVLASDRGDHGLPAHVVAKQPFAGRWEYLIEEAIFTAPVHGSWSGAPLIDAQRRLCGIGSLAIQEFSVGANCQTVNMFVPIDLILPVLDEICANGRRSSAPRPWLGMLVHESDDQLQVVGVYRGCPGDRAGLRPGDLIVAVADTPIATLPALFRTIWAIGDAGTDVPLTVHRDGARKIIVVRSADRDAFQHRGTLQ